MQPRQAKSRFDSILKRFSASAGVACLLTAVVLSLASSRVAMAAGVAANTSLCSSVGGASGSVDCKVIPASGAFSLQIPGTTTQLVGAGALDRAGEVIVVRRTSLICPQLGGFGIQIQTPRRTGLLPPLHWKTGMLFSRNHSTGQCTGIGSPALAAAPGFYQVVPGLGVHAVARTGGAASSANAALGTLSVAWLAGLVSLLLGVALLSRRRFV
ncbi:MAG: hypothetical protein ACR2GA_03930 [Chloroflexota bacterium]